MVNQREDDEKAGQYSFFVSKGPYIHVLMKQRDYILSYQDGAYSFSVTPTYNLLEHKIDVYQTKHKKYERSCRKIFSLAKDCPRLVQAKAMIDFNDKFGVIMPLYEQSDLFELLSKDKKLTDANKIQWLLDIEQGLQFLHVKKYFHRGLKCENVYISDGRAFLGDYDYFHYERDPYSRRTLQGTWKYFPPELLSGYVYNGYKMDVYALGCLCYVLWNNKEAPWNKAKDHYELKGYLEKCKVPKPSDKKSIDYLIWQMLRPNATKRISLVGVIQSLQRLIDSQGKG